MAEADDTGNGVGTSGGDEQHETLKYSLLGPSLLKAGQDSVDQSKVGLLNIPFVLTTTLLG